MNDPQLTEIYKFPGTLPPIQQPPCLGDIGFRQSTQSACRLLPRSVAPTFPSASQYNEIVQNPGTYFLNHVIAARRVARDAIGLPKVFSGGFALTYRFIGPGDDIAVRCFYKSVPNLFERYRAISKFLRRLRSPFFVRCALVEEGFWHEQWRFPIVLMQWINGITLQSFVKSHRCEPVILGFIRRQLLSFAREQAQNGYAHGDLHPRNILVRPDGRLKFVDYDNIFVPGLAHLKAANTGQPTVQSPLYNQHDFGPRMDRFSLLALDLSLEALQKAPQLFHEFSSGENLLLSSDDLADPRGSPVLAAMERLPALAGRVALFRDLCATNLSELPTLDRFQLVNRRQITRFVEVTPAPCG